MSGIKEGMGPPGSAADADAAAPKSAALKPRLPRTKTIRVTLDITLRAMTQAELADSGMERPYGSGAGWLSEVHPQDLGEMIQNAIGWEDTQAEMWAGSNQFAVIKSVELHEAKATGQ